MFNSLRTMAMHYSIQQKHFGSAFLLCPLDNCTTPFKFGFFDGNEPVMASSPIALTVTAMSPLRFGSFMDGEINRLTKDRTMQPDSLLETVVVHFRRLSGGRVTVQKPLHTVNLALIMKEIEHSEGIPPSLQRVTHCGKSVDEASFFQLLRNCKSPVKELDLSVTMRIVGGAFAKKCRLVWPLRSNPIVAGSTLMPAQSFNEENPTEEVEGSFEYSPPEGTPLVAGVHTVSVKFTPTNMAYEAAEMTQTIDVLPSPQPITIDWATPVPIEYGTPLSAAQLNATCPSTRVLPSAWEYTPPRGAFLRVGTHTINVSAMPVDTLRYCGNSHAVEIQVYQATPLVQWNPALVMTVGQLLAKERHLNAHCEIPGTISFDRTAGEELEVGEHALTMTFTPEDAVNYAVVTRTVTLVVKNHIAVDMEYVREFAQGMPECTHKHLLLLKYALNDAFNHLSEASKVQTVRTEVDYLITELKRDGRWNDRVEAQLKLLTSSLKGISPGKKDNITDHLKVVYTLLCPFDILEFSELVKKANAAVTALQDKHCVLLFGKTGCGKSTTINYLAGAIMRPCADSVEVESAPEALASFKISNAGKSETRYINATPITFREEEVWLCDTPGFDDTEGPEVDIANGMGLISAANACASVRPLVLINRQGGGRSEEFGSVCKNVAAMLSNKLDDYIEKFTFAVTRIADETFLDNFLVSASTINLVAKDQKTVRSVIIDEKHGSNQVHAVMPCGSEARRKQFLAQIMRKGNMIDRPRDVFKYYYTSQSEGRVAQQLNDMKQAVLTSLERGEYAVVQFNIEQMKFLRSLLKDLDPNDTFHIERAVTYCVREVEKCFDELYSAASTELFRCSEDGNKLTIHDMARFREKLLTFYKVHTETTLLTLSPEIRQYYVLEQDVLAVANTLLHAFSPSAESAQSCLAKIQLLAQEMNALMTLHPDKLLQIHARALEMCDEEVAARSKSAETAYLEACEYCISMKAGAAAVDTEGGESAADAYVQERWRLFCREFEKVLHISAARGLEPGLAVDATAILDGFMIHARGAVDRRLSACCTEQGSASVADKVTGLFNLVFFVDSLDNAAMSVIERLRDFRTEVKADLVTRVSAYIHMRIDQAREGLNASPEPDFDTVSFVIEEVNQLNSLPYVGVRVADKYQELRGIVMDMISKLIGEANIILQKLQTQSAFVHATAVADRESFLEINPYASFDLCLYRLKAANSWIDASTRDSLLRRITQEVLTHVKTSAQMIESCNVLKLKNYGRIKKVNLILKDVGYLRQSIDKVFLQYDLEAEKLVSGTHRVVVSALRSIQSGCEFNDRATSVKTLDQVISFDAFETALHYLEECEENFSELDRADQSLILQQPAAVEMEQSAVTTMAQAKHEARKYVDDQLRLYMKLIEDMLTSAAKKIAASESDDEVMTVGTEDTEGPNSDSESVMTLQQRSARFPGSSRQELAGLENAVQVYRGVFVQFDAIKPKYPLLYTALGAEKVRVDASEFFENARELLDTEFRARLRERQSIAQQLQCARYLRRLDPYVFTATSIGTFNSVYQEYVSRELDIVQTELQELKEAIRRHAFASVTVDRINNFASPDTRNTILLLLQEAFEDFSSAIDSTLRALEAGLDQGSIKHALSGLSKFDLLRPVCHAKLVTFDVGHLREHFHERLAALLEKRWAEVTFGWNAGEYSTACALKETVHAIVKGGALSTMSAYAPLLANIAAFDQNLPIELNKLACHFEMYSADEIMQSHPPARVFTSLGTALLNFKLDTMPSMTLQERLKQVLEARFAGTFTDCMQAAPLSDFDAAFYGRLQAFAASCPSDLANVLNARAAECYKSVKSALDQEAATLRHYGDTHDIASLKSCMERYSKYDQPKINSYLSTTLQHTLGLVENDMNVPISSYALDIDRGEMSFADFQDRCLRLREFYGTFRSVYPEKRENALRQATNAVHKRIARDCAVLTNDESGAADLQRALFFLGGVVQAYNPAFFDGASLGTSSVVELTTESSPIIGKIRIAFVSFVDHFIAENEQCAEYLHKSPLQAKKSFATLKGIEPSLVAVKRLAEQNSRCMDFFSSAQRDFLTGWVSLDAKFMSMNSELYTLVTGLKTQKFLVTTLVDTSGESQVIERAGVKEVADFYADLFKKLEQMMSISSTISISDPAAGEDMLRQVGEHLNAQCNLVRTTIKAAVTELHLATKPDDFRVFSMCYNHLCGMLRHDFGKFSDRMQLFRGVDADLADAKTATTAIASGSLAAINLIIQQINDESVKFNNDRQVREDYVIPMYREVLRVHLYSVNLVHLTSTLQSSLNQTFSNMKNANDKGRKMIIYLGTYLKANMDGMDPHGLGLDVMEIYSCFDNFMNSVFESRTKAQDITYVLDRIRGSPSINRPDVEQYYKQFNDAFYKTMNAHLLATEDQIDALASDIVRTAARFHALQVQKSHSLIPDVLAKIFALWSLMSSGQLDANETNTVTEFHKKPHPVQIVAVFQMLGMSGKEDFWHTLGYAPKRVLDNHLVQIGTGEGKSVVLAMTSILLALFGYDVNCASYSALLSTRDYEAFLTVFKKLDIEQYITYGTFYTLCENVINENGDVRDLLKSAILPTGKPVSGRKSTRPRILLIDEVDVFFKEDFYGECYTPLADIGVDELPLIEPLTDWIWANRANASMTLATVKAARADVAGVQVEIYKALEATMGGYTNLLEEVVKSMICHVKSFDKYKWIVKGGKICYKEQDSYSDKISYGYRTMFAYYFESEQNNLPIENLRKAKKISLRCGSFSFAEIPKRPNFEYILGVTGTLEFLSSYEKSILEKEYGIKRQTYMPSAYGVRADKFDYAPTKQQHIILVKPEDHHRVICEQITQLVGFDVGTRRAVLVFFDTVESLQAFEKESGLNSFRNLKMLNVIVEELGSLEKAKLVREASSAGRVTLLTKAFGRGIDFFCKDQEVVDNKGVVVLQTFLSDNLSEEIQIKGRTARQGQSGSYRMILDKKSLERYLIRANDLACSSNALEDMLNAKRDEFYKTTYANNRSDVKKAEEMHIQFLGFIKNMLSRSTAHVQDYLLAENKAEVMLSLGKGGTLILLDATCSMSHCMKNAKSKVRDIFTLAFQVLEKHGIPTGSITLQFAAYRNYDSTHDLLFQCSKWENNANNLIDFLKPLEVSGGWGNEAIEVGFEHAAREAEAGRLAQVIVIGDVGANTSEEVAQKRAERGEKYWLDHGFPNPTYAEAELARLSACNVPVYPFYVCKSARAAFEGYAAKTGGKADFLNVNSSRGGELLTDFITERVLYSIGGENGAALVSSYKEIASEARAKGYSR